MKDHFNNISHSTRPPTSQQFLLACLDPRETTRVSSRKGLFCSSCTNCDSWEWVRLQ